MHAARWSNSTQLHLRNGVDGVEAGGQDSVPVAGVAAWLGQAVQRRPHLSPLQALAIQILHIYVGIRPGLNLMHYRRDKMHLSKFEWTIKTTKIKAYPFDLNKQKTSSSVKS